MDHQDWPGWPDDGEHPHDEPADTTDPGGHDGWGPEPVGHEPLADDGPGPDPYGHDRLDADAGGPGYPGVDDDPGVGHDHLGTGGDAYPDDDPFAPADHGGHAAFAGGPDAEYPVTVGHEGPLPYDPVQVDPHPFEHVDPHPFEHVDPLEYPVGADPDAGIAADVDWPEHPFPPALDLPDVPQPVDGYPWADPHLLGAGLPDPAAGGPDDHSVPVGGPDDHSTPVGDLYAYAGEEYAGDESGGGGWPELIASEDPATGALARWWVPRS